MKSTPSVHVLGDFNFEDTVWPDRHNKCGPPLSKTEEHILVDIIDDHGFEELVHIPTTGLFKRGPLALASKFRSWASENVVQLVLRAGWIFQKKKKKKKKKKKNRKCPQLVSHFQDVKMSNK